MKSTALYLSLTGLIALSSAPALAQDSQLEAIYKCRDIESDTDRLACFDAAVGRVKQAEEAGEFTTVTREDVQQVERDAFGFSLPSLPRFSLPDFGGRARDDLESVRTTDASEMTEEMETAETTETTSTEAANVTEQVTAQSTETPQQDVPKEERNKDGQLQSITIGIKSIRQGPYGKLTVSLDNGQVWQQTDNKRVRVSKRFPPEEATVRRAAIGSFLMRLDNKGKSFRVRRVN